MYGVPISAIIIEMSNEISDTSWVFNNNNHSLEKTRSEDPDHIETI